MRKRRETGASVHCEQFEAVEPPGVSHIFNAESQKVLCVACDNYRRKNGEEARRLAQIDIKKKRADGIPLYYDECGKVETPAYTGRKRFSCSGATNRLLCMTCSNKAYNAAMKAKKAAKDVGSGT
jgi:hypothetical protein